MPESCHSLHSFLLKVGDEGMTCLTVASKCTSSSSYSASMAVSSISERTERGSPGRRVGGKTIKGKQGH
jgi:hypothetical protein